MNRKPRLYLAGPYTKPDPVVNVRRACLVADKLLAVGFSVYVPHILMLWHLVSPKPIEEWYAIDLEWLAACDVMVRLTGESMGADREEEHADSLGIDVFYGTVDDGVDCAIMGWLDAWRRREEV